MKTTLDQSTRDELITRINSLTENSTALWGKMNVYQMVKHCRLWEEMLAGNIKSKRVFIGWLFGKQILKSVLKDEKPMRLNSPTTQELRVHEREGDFTIERNKWIVMIKEYPNFSNTNFIHPFFGKMTKEQIGQHAYKHIDHHLRQFNS